jgi:hypothetical protein
VVEVIAKAVVWVMMFRTLRESWTIADANTVGVGMSGIISAIHRLYSSVDAIWVRLLCLRLLVRAYNQYMCTKEKKVLKADPSHLEGSCY